MQLVFRGKEYVMPMKIVAATFYVPHTKLVACQKKELLFPEKTQGPLEMDHFHQDIQLIKVAYDFFKVLLQDFDVNKNGLHTLQSNKSIHITIFQNYTI